MGAAAVATRARRLKEARRSGTWNADRASSFRHPLVTAGPGQTGNGGVFCWT